MHIIEGLVIQQGNGRYMAVILRLNHDEPNCDTIMEKDTSDENEANIWLDDEMSRLITGKGVWDV